MFDDSFVERAVIGRADKSKAKAKLLWPDTPLASCIATGVVRDTRGANLCFEDRYNNFSTSPYCALSWIVEGTVRVSNNSTGIDPREWPLMPKVAVSGPTDTPTVSWNDADVFAVTIGFLPDAWFALTGISAAKVANEIFDAHEFLPPEFAPSLKCFSPTEGVDEGFQRLQDCLIPIWRRNRPAHAIIPNDLTDWINRGLAKLAANGVGKSTRQLQRRIKQWTGLTRREIQAHSRGEELYKSFLASRGDAGFSISQLAAEHGYADQSHLGRDVKRITGMSPKQIDDLFDHEERFWYYRLLKDFY